MKTKPEKLYKNYYRNEIGGRFGLGIESVIKMFRFFRAFKVWLIVGRLDRSVLDVGSGRGFMLYYLRKYFGFKKVVGTQISKPALEFSRRRLGLTVYDGDLIKLKLPSGSFNVITIWHVLEHVKDPEGYLAEMRRLLKRGGKLVVEVPNFASWTRKWTGCYWLGLDLKYHLSFFDYESLEGLLEKYGFMVKKRHNFSLEYSSFISSQSIISWLTKSDQVFFNWLQKPDWDWRILFYGSLFLVLMPLCFLVNILLYFSNRGEVLLLVAEKLK
ncbi:class I SAM-dependent methyltransferase [Patescibacteria group bacterium]|nr:class I SAM-dependent methyltransferase [Patescibacteria group bacterium]